MHQLRTKFQRQVQGHLAGGRRQRIRALSLLFVALVTMFSATVAWGQASLSFDLACRSIINGGGGISTSTNFGVIATIGQPVAPQADNTQSPTYSVRSTNFGVRAGFLPGYPTTSSVVTAANHPDQAQVQRLPVIAKFVRLVRGGC